MSDSPKTEGGYESDLREAENAMIAAGHPDIALGMRRHSEAQRNMMQGVLVPMFANLVERILGPKIDGLRTDVQTWALESAARLGKLETRLDIADIERDALHKRVTLIEQILAERPGQRAAEHQALLRAINSVRDEHTTDHDGD